MNANQVKAHVAKIRHNLFNIVNRVAHLFDNYDGGNVYCNLSMYFRSHKRSAEAIFFNANSLQGAIQLAKRMFGVTFKSNNDKQVFQTLSMLDAERMDRDDYVIAFATILVCIHSGNDIINHQKNEELREEYAVDNFAHGLFCVARDNGCASYSYLHTLVLHVKQLLKDEAFISGRVAAREAFRRLYIAGRNEEDEYRRQYHNPLQFYLRDNDEIDVFVRLMERYGKAMQPQLFNAAV